MLEVPKYVKIGIIVVLALILVLVSWKISRVITNNSYDIGEITEGVGETTEPTESVETFETSPTDVPEAVKDQHSLQQGESPDEEYAVVNALAILMNSPMAKDIGRAEYEVKMVDGKWVTRFECKEYSIFVTCDTTYFSPYMYTCTRQYTDVELEFFRSIGKAWEVENEDGTYTVYYN